MKMLSVCLSPVLRQYLIIITANLGFVTIGLYAAWTSPVLVKLKNESETVLSRPITDEEGSWIVSIGAITGLFLTFPIGFIMDRLGRKTCILLGFVPRLTACFLLMFAQEVWVVLLGRGIDGMANAFMMCLPTYASEIAGKECRGVLGTISQVASAVGMLIFFSLGPFMPYFEMNSVYTCIVTIAYIPIWFIPETPYYLYSRGRKEDSLKVLTYIRGSETLAAEECKQYSLSQTKTSTKAIFKNRTTRITFAKVVLLSILLEVNGYNAVLFYMQTVLKSTRTSIGEDISSVINGCIQLVACFFTILLTDRFGRKPILVTTLIGMAIGMTVLKSTHTSIGEDISSVINGCIQLVACFFTILLTDRFGRKPILVTTLIGMAIGMIGLGTFFQLQQEGYPIIGFLNFMPLLSMMLVIFCFNAGLGALFWIVVAELFDGPARATGVSAGVFVAQLFVFLTTKYFAMVTSAIGAPNTYWIFSVNCIITALFFAILVPETKGKTFIEIQEELGRRKTGKIVLEKE